jgi:hypothetical protein
MSDENILINIDEDCNYDLENNYSVNNDDDANNNELEKILKEIENTPFDMRSNLYNNISESETMVKLIDYNLNYNIKQLLLICEYYGLLKEVKINKMKKLEVIYFLLDFEENIDNTCIVYKRKQLWYFMSELKNVKFMKKFVLW